MVEQNIYYLLPADLPKVIGELPGGNQNAVSIVLFDGVGSDHYFATGTLFRPVVKLIVRNASYEEAQSQVQQICEVLHKHTDDYFLSIHLSGYPMYLGKGEQKLHEFQIVFNIQLKE